MHDLRTRDRTLRWGGLAGVLGSILLLAVFGIVAVFVGMEPLDPVTSITRFPEIRAARTVENSLYLVTLVLWVVHALALYRVLRETSPASALFGSVVAIVGLAVLATGALPHIATAPLSDLYHAPSATAQEQAMVALLWAATQGVFDALLATGLVIAPLGVIGLGAAMRHAPAFGRRVGGTSVALGLIGLAAAIALLVSVSAIAVAGVLALLVFHLVLGWRLYRLSRTTKSPAHA